MEKERIYIIYHSFYPDYQNDLEDINKLSELYDVQLIMNNISGVCIDRGCLPVLENAVVFSLPNKGKDLLAKLYALLFIDSQGWEHAPVLFLHDKKSPQVNRGREWKEKLFKILTAESAKIATTSLKAGKSIICSKESWMSTENLTKQELVINHETTVLKEATTMGLAIDDFSFVGGTMFWTHSKYFKPLLDNFSVSYFLEHLEPKNILDLQGSSYTHAWERLLTYIVTSQNNNIKLI